MSVVSSQVDGTTKVMVDVPEPTQAPSAQPRKGPGRPKGSGKLFPALRAEAGTGTEIQWADHSDEHIEIMQAEIAWSVEHMLGIPRGLVAASFVERGRETIRRCYPRLVKSALHRALDVNPSILVTIPDWARKRLQQTVRLCDLIETMMIDANTTG